MCPNGRLTEGETSEFDRCKHLDVDMGKWAVELAAQRSGSPWLYATEESWSGSARTSECRSGERTFDLREGSIHETR